VRCQSCGKEIDDKAIVCYRCGEPTAVAARPVPPAGRRPRWGLIAIIAVIVGLAVWLVPMTPPDSPARMAAFAAVALATFVSVRLYGGRRPGRRGHRVD